MTTYALAKTALTLAATRTARLAALSAGGAPVAGWSVNAPQRIEVDHDSQVLVDESVIRAAIAGMIDLATLASMDEDWCDAFAAWFDETRIPAIAAVWDTPMSSTALPQSIGPATVIQIQVDNGQILNATQAATVSLPASIRFTARVAGTAGNSLGGSEPRVLSGPAGLTFTGAGTLFTSGRDAETNAALIARCLAKWARLGAAWTLDAFDYLIPLGSATVTRWRVRDDNPFGEGTTGVVLANSSGAATGQEVSDVYDKLTARDVKPLGSGAVTVAAAVEDALVITITVVGDGTNADLETNIEDALEALINAFPLGPADLDDDLVRGIALGGAYTSIAIDIGSTTATIAPSLPGFTGAVSISALSLAAPHSLAIDEVLVATITVTVT